MHGPLDSVCTTCMHVCVCLFYMLHNFSFQRACELFRCYFSLHVSDFHRKRIDLGSANRPNTNIKFENGIDKEVFLIVYFHKIYVRQLPQNNRIECTTLSLSLSLALWHAECAVLLFAHFVHVVAATFSFAVNWDFEFGFLYHFGSYVYQI